MKFGFLAFFEAKMTKIVILDQKLIVPNDYQQYILIGFYHFFQTLDVKYLLSLIKLKVHNIRTFWS